MFHRKGGCSIGVPSLFDLLGTVGSIDFISAKRLFYYLVPYVPLLFKLLLQKRYCITESFCCFWWNGGTERLTY